MLVAKITPPLCSRTFFSVQKKMLNDGSVATAVCLCSNFSAWLETHGWYFNCDSMSAIKSALVYNRSSATIRVSRAILLIWWGHNFYFPSLNDSLIHEIWWIISDMIATAATWQFLLFSFFDTSILEPRFDLFFRQTQRVSQFDTSPSRHVLTDAEFTLQLTCLMRWETRATSHRWI